MIDLVSLSERCNEDITQETIDAVTALISSNPTMDATQFFLTYGYDIRIYDAIQAELSLLVVEDDGEEG